jgi:hypothetical protein
MITRILSVSPWIGCLWLGVLLTVCFAAVHVARLACLGRRYQKQQNAHTTTSNEPPKEKTPPVQKQEEPIYYIVERKKRVKSTFTEPKQIRFK